jgi:hypothetical protein
MAASIVSSRQGKRAFIGFAALLTLIVSSVALLPASAGAETGVAPTVTTNAATEVTARTAKLNGTVNPNGLSTTYQFEWGTTTSYGNSRGGAIGSGTVDVKVSTVLIDPLEPNTTYHYRVVASNEKGVSKGSDQTFTTSAWEIQYPAEVEAKSSRLRGVSCTAAAQCISVGEYTSTSGSVHSLAQRSKGTGFTSEWTFLETPNPAGAKSSNLQDVSCTSSSNCVAVGSYNNEAGTTVTLAERFDGEKWTVLTTLNPAGAKSSSLEGVSCASSTDCVATGSYKNEAGTTVTLAERFDGEKWTILTTVSPGTRSQFEDVSCAKAGDCRAVGFYITTTKLIPLIEHFDGTKWTDESPAGETEYILTAVSCPTTSFCMTGSNGWTYIQRFNGIKWSKESLPSPPESCCGASITVRQVSCTSASACFGIGTVGSSWPFAERWDGSKWTVAYMTDPSDAFGAHYNTDIGGVSCFTSSACTFVGYFSNTLLGFQPRMLAEVRE